MKRLTVFQSALARRVAARCCVLLTMMGGAALAQTTGTVNPNPAPAEPAVKQDVPPGGCMPIGLTASGEIVFPIQCKEFIDRERGKAVEQLCRLQPGSPPQRMRNPPPNRSPPWCKRSRPPGNRKPGLRRKTRHRRSASRPTNRLKPPPCHSAPTPIRASAPRVPRAARTTGPMMRSREPTGAMTEGVVPADPFGRFPPRAPPGVTGQSRRRGGGVKRGTRRLFAGGKPSLVRNNGIYVR